MVVKTFRGLLADGGQDRIRLQTIKGKVGYRIVKLKLIATDPDETVESTLKIYKTQQSSVTNGINFTDNDLLAAAIYHASTDNYRPMDIIIVMDKEIFNQDIYVTLQSADYSASLNYYIELEVIPLDDAGAEYTTLKDMRQT